MGLSHSVRWLKSSLQGCVADRLTQLINKVEWAYLTNVSYRQTNAQKINLFKMEELPPCALFLLTHVIWISIVSGPVD